jgi:sporulation protein YlmC with PRC-barrel domain
MLINSKKLINLPVYTQSDEYLGKVISFDLDAESFLIKKFSVRKYFASGELLIAKDQVVAIDADRMTVVDLLVKKLAEQINETPLAVEKIEPVITAKLD